MNHSPDTGSYCLKTALAVFAAALLISGCVNNQKTIGPYSGTNVPPVPPVVRPAVSQAEQADHARNVLMPALASISGRIANYEQKLQEWQELQSRQASLNLSPDQAMQVTTCSNKASDIHAAYQRLHSSLLSEETITGSRQLITGALQTLEQKDINYLEGNCPGLTASFTTTLPGSNVVMDPVQTVDLSLKAALENGDYGAVIRSYEGMSLSPGQYPDNGTTYAYGLALLKNGREQEGQQVFEKLLERIRLQGQGNWELTLLQQLADLDFGLREFPAARSRYEELNTSYAAAGSMVEWAGQQLTAIDAAALKHDEMRDYAALLLSYLTYNPQRDGFTVVQQAQAFFVRYPVSTVSSIVSELTAKASQDAEQWFSSLMNRADQLNADQNGGLALQLLEQVPPDILPRDKQDLLRQKKESISITVNNANSVAGKMLPQQNQPEINDTILSEPIPPVPVTALQETWNQGIVHLKAKEYDQAIGIFSGLKNTSYGSRAHLKIAEASQLAAREDRTRAAELFQRANSATDPAARKQLLLSSRSLLMGILQKYPQAGIEDKVRRNLSRLNQELAVIEQAEMQFTPPTRGSNVSSETTEQLLPQ
jgi:tetratricopeptide (TPR) repeat protein